ncbi:MAG TPA: hypothetical protein EYP57_04810 [Thermodesulfobacteriaceae bacterium]|nr:hypothetical protein [Thermodesulfobacteriaceae bacterium]
MMTQIHASYRHETGPPASGKPCRLDGLPLRLAVIVLTCVLLAAGCASRKQPTGQVQYSLPALKLIAVTPVDRASIAPGLHKATCSLSDEVFDANPLPPETSEAVTRILFDRISGDSRFVPVSEGQCVAFLDALLAENVRTSQIRLIQAFGRQFNADAVLYSKLFRYQERIGSDYSVASPASVAFSMHLIRVIDGAILWRSSFDKTQQSFSQNIFDYKFYRQAGMRWLTASKLAEVGITNALDDLMKLLPPLPEK